MKAKIGPQKLDTDFVLSTRPIIGQVNHLLNIAMSSCTFVVVSKNSLFAMKDKSSALIKSLILLRRDVNS